mmetsp:Transcript_1467/g.3217  ORF Transcript_1467/g.3217 Transcript_1467/m.3217 type:complete len:309 (-) Transcript_1467:2833-3759(-)
MLSVDRGAFGGSIWIAREVRLQAHSGRSEDLITQVGAIVVLAWDLLHDEVKVVSAHLNQSIRVLLDLVKRKSWIDAESSVARQEGLLFHAEPVLPVHADKGILDQMDASSLNVPVDRMAEDAVAPLRQPGLEPAVHDIHLEDCSGQPGNVLKGILATGEIKEADFLHEILPTCGSDVVSITLEWLCQIICVQLLPSCLHVAKDWLEVGTVVPQANVLLLESLEVGPHLLNLGIHIWQRGDAWRHGRAWNVLGRVVPAVCAVGHLQAVVVVASSEAHAVHDSGELTKADGLPAVGMVVHRHQSWRCVRA